MKRKVKIIINFIKFFVAKVFSYIYLLFAKREYFVFLERGVDAQDNAFILYNYFKENGYKTKYIICKKSLDARKIIASERIEYESFKHFLYIHIAKSVISTHAIHYMGTHWERFSKHYKIKAPFIFLQHGIIKEDLKSLYYPEFQCSLFLCTAHPEYIFVKDHFNHPADVVQCLGMPRYDLLIDTSSTNDKIILIMPTFSTIEARFFEDSSFFNNFSKLILDKRLISFCRENNITIRLYLHYEFQKFSHHFEQFNNDVFSVIKFGEVTVQDLLKSSNCLVTDYSSVAFDFAYMKKPIIYLQYDPQFYYDTHYKYGYFDYEKMGFGPVVNSPEQVSNELISIFEQNDYKYAQRVDNFFANIDYNNRQRVMKRILDIIK